MIETGFEDNGEGTDGEMLAYNADICLCVLVKASSMVIAVDDMDNMLEPLPKQLEAVKPATEFPAERHRWNTNEVTTCK